jgi:hypothetical protein
MVVFSNVGDTQTTVKLILQKVNSLKYLPANSMYVLLMQVEKFNVGDQMQTDAQLPPNSPCLRPMPHGTNNVQHLPASAGSADAPSRSNPARLSASA